MWDIYLNQVLNKSSLYVRDGGMLFLQYLANDRTAKLYYNDYGHAGSGSHQIQPLHPILPVVPPTAMGQD